MGLIDINDRPYEELTAAARSLQPDKIHACIEKVISKSNKSFSVPFASVDVEKGLLRWNKELSFVESSYDEQQNLPFADLYSCWDKNNIYLAVYAMDFAESRLYARNLMPETERMTWTIHTGSRSQPVAIHFGPGGEPVTSGAPVEYKSWSSSTRFTILVKLPASLSGKKNWQSGDKLQIRAKLASHSRAESMEWKNVFHLKQTGVESASKNSSTEITKSETPDRKSSYYLPGNTDRNACRLRFTE
jgi:hypothetical protein